MNCRELDPELNCPGEIRPLYSKARNSRRWKFTGRYQCRVCQQAWFRDLRNNRMLPSLRTSPEERLLKIEAHNRSLLDESRGPDGN